MSLWRVIRDSLIVVVAVSVSDIAVFAAPNFGAAVYGNPKYNEKDRAFGYVNPDAPKGGSLRLASVGSFDSLNPFIIKGNPADGLGMTYDTLMKSTLDEPLSVYGLVAKSIDIDRKNKTVTFELRPQAKFSDGHPVTADDIVFSFITLKAHGAPAYRFQFRDVESVHKVNLHKVRFKLADGDNRKLPLTLGGLPVLPKHYWLNRDFSTTTLEIPVSSGPYIISAVDSGKSITYAANPDYWGKDIMVNRGYNNFGEIKYDYYRDSTVSVQALKAGAFDMRVENEAKKWANSYGGDIGRLEKIEFANGRPNGMQGFVFNTRLPIFADPRLRQALGYALDFEWTNKNLFSDSYKRSNSYFANSAMAAVGKPTGKELKLLERHREELPPEVFGKAYEAPVTDGSGYPRENLAKALALLEQAGWTVGDDQVLRDKNGRAMEFEILLDIGMGSAWERITLPFVRNLKKLGIKATVRILDPIIYDQRMKNYNFEMTTFIWPSSLAPGPELNVFFGSASADIPNTFNVAGIRSASIDDLIRHVIKAENYDDLTAAARALDRALTFGYYVIPHWHLPLTRMLVDTQKLSWPDKSVLQGTDTDIWWVK